MFLKKVDNFLKADSPFDVPGDGPVKWLGGKRRSEGRQLEAVQNLQHPGLEFPIELRLLEGACRIKTPEKRKMGMQIVRDLCGLFQSTGF
jgi:hypothetical protein